MPVSDKENNPEFRFSRKFTPEGQDLPVSR
jgi:hypothetical protein